MKKIEEIDQNFAQVNHVTEPDIVWYDVQQEPFQLYGLYEPNAEGNYRRLNEDTARETSEAVHSLCFHTSGGRIRFSTDSAYVAIHVELQAYVEMANMSPSGHSSFDLYEDFEDHSMYLRSFLAPLSGETVYERISDVFPVRKMRQYTVHFPLYNGVKKVYIGLQKDAKVLQGKSYKGKAPIVYYGSSITQGGCSSRPGLDYQAIIARKLNRDYVNLGFSGSGKGELAIANYMAKLPMSAFVMDYDHNAATLDDLIRTHERLFTIVRKANPTLPIIMVGRPDRWVRPYFYKESRTRRDVILKTYLNAREKGDENVHFLDGFTLFAAWNADEFTVDACHPNDLGFMKMAECIGMQLQLIFDGEQECSAEVTVQR